MPRPILKTLSSYASPHTNSASKSDKKRVVFKQRTKAIRRVTFSPFTKPRIKSLRPHLTGTNTDGTRNLWIQNNNHLIAAILTFDEEINGSLTSGFTFSSVTTAEKKIQSSRRKEQQIVQILYRAAKRSSYSVKSLLLANVPGLQQLRTCAMAWLNWGKRIRDSVFRLQCVHTKRLPRMLHKGPWTELDDADHKYIQQLTLSSTSSPTTYLQLSPDFAVVDHPLASVYRLPQLDLPPPNRGHFANLLRKEGILVDEDERQLQQVISEDLRGLGHSANRQRS